MSFLIPSTDFNANKSLDWGNVADWFSQASDVVSAFSNNKTPEAQSQKAVDDAAASAKSKKTWNIFIGIAILIILAFLGWLLIKKNK